MKPLDIVSFIAKGNSSTRSSTQKSKYYSLLLRHRVNTDKPLNSYNETDFF